jgi:hypothetical protein
MNENLTDDFKKTSKPVEKTDNPKPETNKLLTEIVELPSKGLVYDKSNPLSKGFVEMRYMTAADEDILLSKNLVVKGVAIDKLLQTLIVTPINYGDLIIGDKNALIFAARIMGYGKDYSYTVKCPSCNRNATKKVDLTTLPFKELDESVFTKGKNEFDFQLPYSKSNIKFKLITQADNEMIEAETNVAKRTKKGIEGEFTVDPVVTSRLFYAILSVDNNTDKMKIREFIHSLRAGDSRSLRKYIADISPDIQYEIDFSCSNCGFEDYSYELVPDVEFFWPRT